MLNNRNFLAQINQVVAKLVGQPKITPKRLRTTIFQGVGPKKGVMGLHRDIKRQKLSRYPKIHQGGQECARRRGKLRRAKLKAA